MKVEYYEFNICGRGDVVFVGVHREHWWEKINRIGSMVLF